MKKLILLGLLFMASLFIGSNNVNAGIILPPPNHSPTPYCELLGGEGKYIDYETISPNTTKEMRYYFYQMPFTITMRDAILTDKMEGKIGDVMTFSVSRGYVKSYAITQQVGQTYSENYGTSMDIKIGSDNILQVGFGFSHTFNLEYSKYLSYTRTIEKNYETTVSRQMTIEQDGFYSLESFVSYYVYIVQEFKTHIYGDMPYFVDTGNYDVVMTEVPYSRYLQVTRYDNNIEGYFAPYVKNNSLYIRGTNLYVNF